MSADYTDVVIYHNPEFGTSRNALTMIRNSRIEPHVVEYLKTPPSRGLLRHLLERMEDGEKITDAAGHRLA